jgi:hypothetical protein
MQIRESDHLYVLASYRVSSLSVNDMTVLYVTAAIELEDPFLNHLSNGIKM